MNATAIGDALNEMRARIEDACRRSGRLPDDVTLVAVTKTVPLSVVRLAYQAGAAHFGENYARELRPKAAALPQATWHFIGTLQRGNAAPIATFANVIHSAEPGDALSRIAARANRDRRRIRCLIQVDFTGRRQGVSPEDLADAVTDVSRMEGLALAGLMTLPPWPGDPEATRPTFRRLRELRDDLLDRWPELRELSMGMSGDYEVAVEEGATMVRVGTALFGQRPGTEEHPASRSGGRGADRSTRSG